MATNDKKEDETLKRRAYVLGLQLKSENYDSEVIYARLEKQGIPASLARKVSDDIMLEKQNEEKENMKPELYSAFVGIGAGLISSIVFAIAFPGHLVIPLGLIISGAIHSLIVYEKMNRK